MGSFSLGRSFVSSNSSLRGERFTHQVLSRQHHDVEHVEHYRRAFDELEFCSALNDGSPR